MLKDVNEWRNDVKDFLSDKVRKYDLESLAINLNIKDSNEVIPVKLDRPDLIFGITFLILPKSYKHLAKKYAIHPITNKEIPIFLDNINNPHLGIPAHNDKDYEFAELNKLPIKQVVMPVNASLDDNKPREDKEWSYRENVVLIVKHWLEDKFLYIDYKKQNWKCFISGGIEKNESPKEAALRELKEESGFYNVKIIKEMPFKMANVFYAAHKGVNRYSIVTSFYIELENSHCLELDSKEKEEHEVKWSNKEELYEILKNGFTDQIWLLKELLGEIKAYTGMGKMINSEFLNDLENPKEATKKVKDYLTSK